MTIVTAAAACSPVVNVADGVWVFSPPPFAVVGAVPPGSVSPFCVTTCWTNGSFGAKTVNDVSFSVVAADVGAAPTTATGVVVPAGAGADCSGVVVAVVVAAAAGDDPPRSFGSWIASRATRKSPPATTKIFCFRSRAARAVGGHGVLRAAVAPVEVLPVSCAPGGGVSGTIGPSYTYAFRVMVASRNGEALPVRLGELDGLHGKEAAGGANLASPHPDETACSLEKASDLPVRALGRDDDRDRRRSTGSDDRLAWRDRPERDAARAREPVELEHEPGLIGARRHGLRQPQHVRDPRTAGRMRPSLLELCIGEPELGRD